MRFNFSLLALGASAFGAAAQDSTAQATAQGSTAQATAQATTSQSSAPTQTAGGLSGPCSSIQSLQASQSSAGAASPTYPPSVAWECMASIPINQNDATSLMTWAQIYFPFMSTIGWLKNPPPSYVRPAFDFLGGLQQIASNVNSSAISAQLDLDIALNNITINTRDFHNNAFAGALGMFNFGTTNISFVALSPDGVSLPKIYRYEDIVSSSNSSNQVTAFTAPAVQSINGQDPVQYLRNYTAVNIPSAFIEEHAEWNSQMYHGPASQGNPTTTLFGSSFYNGDSLQVTFEGGNTVSYEFIALANCDITHANSMDDVYNICVLKDSTSTPTAAATSLGSFPTSAINSDAADGYEQWTATAEAALETDNALFPNVHEIKQVDRAEVSSTPISSWPAPYPTNPVVIQKDLGVSGVVTGYNLVDESIAVLSLPKFEEVKDGQVPNDINLNFEYSDAVGRFIDISTKAGMKQVVIDLTANGGGRVFLGYEVFKRFFPDVSPYAGWNLRATPQVTAIGTAYTNSFTNATVQAQLKQVNKTLPLADPSNVYGDLSDNGTSYTTWAQAGGPDTRDGDNFTYTIRFDYTNSATMSSLAGGALSDLYGYGSRPANGSRPWDPSNIILLTDGTCGSTCALFAEMMKTEVGVKNVVMGGLPMAGPMQGVSGSRGCQVLDMPTISQGAGGVRSLQPGAAIEANLPPDVLQPRLAQTGRAGRVNIKNSVRRGSDVPLQFTYEAADCRLWYTPPMIQDLTVLWKAAANVLSGNLTMCVQGSTNQVTAKPNVTSIDSPNATTIDNGAQASTAGASVPSGTGASAPSGTSSAPPGTTSKSIAAVGAVAQGAFVSFLVSLVSALALI